jgi:predicted NBD/HSP70 family sugar kinase
MAVSGLRLNNERAVLMSITMAPGSSAAEITRTTGLGAQTVSRMLLDLEAAGLILRGEPRRGQRGQPAIPIYLNPHGAFCIGCEVGWRHIEILVQNLGGEILGRHRRDYAFPDFETIFAEIASLSKLMIGLVPEELRARLIGMGVAMPSGFERNLKLLGAPKAKSAQWKGVDSLQLATNATGLDVFMFNDGNAGCWGELAAYPIPRPKNLGYILVSSFVGAGLIVEGKLWEGSRGQSANLGSMTVTGRDGQEEYVHLIASILALEARLLNRGLPVPTGNPLDWDWTAFEDVAAEWIADAGRAIAKTIVNTSAVIELDVVIVDGIAPKAIVERLVTSVKSHLGAMPTLTSEWPQVEIGRLGNAAPALGAAWLPMYRRFFSRERADVDLPLA